MLLIMGSDKGAAGRGGTRTRARAGGSAPRRLTARAGKSCARAHAHMSRRPKRGRRPIRPSPPLPERLAQVSQAELRLVADRGGLVIKPSVGFARDCVASCGGRWRVRIEWRVEEREWRRATKRRAAGKNDNRMLWGGTGATGLVEGRESKDGTHDSVSESRGARAHRGRWRGGVPAPGGARNAQPSPRSQ